MTYLCELRHDSLSDDDSPCSGPTENGKGAERPFIPKRLVIGNEEYVILDSNLSNFTLYSLEPESNI